MVPDSHSSPSRTRLSRRRFLTAVGGSTASGASIATVGTSTALAGCTGSVNQHTSPPRFLVFNDHTATQSFTLTIEHALGTTELHTTLRPDERHRVATPFQHEGEHTITLASVEASASRTVDVTFNCPPAAYWFARTSSASSVEIGSTC